MHYLVQYVLSVITLTALWQLLHLGTPMYGYMLLTSKKPKSAQITARTKNIKNMNKECVAEETPHVLGKIMNDVNHVPK